jgi:hypothetical protein
MHVDHHFYSIRVNKRKRKRKDVKIVKDFNMTRNKRGVLNSRFTVSHTQRAILNEKQNVLMWFGFGDLRT